jgi:hypothetical protein
MIEKELGGRLKECLLSASDQHCRWAVLSDSAAALMDTSHNYLDNTISDQFISPSNSTAAISRLNQIPHLKLRKECKRTIKSFCENIVQGVHSIVNVLIE